MKHPKRRAGPWLAAGAVLGAFACNDLVDVSVPASVARADAGADDASMRFDAPAGESESGATPSGDAGADSGNSGFPPATITCASYPVVVAPGASIKCADFETLAGENAGFDTFVGQPFRVRSPVEGGGAALRVAAQSARQTYGELTVPIGGKRELTLDADVRLVTLEATWAVVFGVRLFTSGGVDACGAEAHGLVLRREAGGFVAGATGDAPATSPATAFAIGEVMHARMHVKLPTFDATVTTSLSYTLELSGVGFAPPVRDVTVKIPPGCIGINARVGALDLSTPAGLVEVDFDNFRSVAQ